MTIATNMHSSSLATRRPPAAGRVLLRLLTAGSALFFPKLRPRVEPIQRFFAQQSGTEPRKGPAFSGQESAHLLNVRSGLLCQAFDLPIDLFLPHREALALGNRLQQQVPLDPLLGRAHGLPIQRLGLNPRPAGHRAGGIEMARDPLPNQVRFAANKARWEVDLIA